MYKLLLFVVFFLLTAQHNFGQTENRSAGWLTSNIAVRGKKQWGTQIDMILRTTDQWKYLQIFILRTGLSYRVSDKLTAIVGASINRTRVTVSTTTGYANEYQVWQQAFIRHRIGPIFTVHRPLLEERFIPTTVSRNNKIEVDGRKFALRARYLFRNLLPFKYQKVFKKGAYAVTQPEIFLNIGDNDAANNKLFDQLRWFTGLGYRFSPKLDIESGYLFRKQATRTDLNYHDHVFQLTCFLRL